MRDTNFVLLVIPELGVNDTWLSNVSNLFSRVHTPTSLTAGTNLLRFTNECFVSYGLNTNTTLSVSNAGLAAANGLYRTNQLNGYTQGIYKICFDAAYGSFVISNASAKVYGLDAFGGTDLGTGNQWEDDFLGNPPTPGSWWGPITNCFTILASSAGLAQPAISTNLYVAETGNDTNAVRGRIDRPWRNIQMALRNTVPGDTVFLGPGRFPTLASAGVQIVLSNRVNLIGQGPRSTLIGTEGGSEESLNIGTLCSVRGVTMFGNFNVGGTGTTCTNVLIENCEIIGAADAIYVSDFESLLSINDCRLVSTYDGLADWDATPGGSNRVIRLRNCHITITNSDPAFLLHGITGNDNRIEMFGGSIEVSGGNANQHNACLYVGVDTFRTNNTGSFLFSNVRFRFSATNGLSWSATNLLRLPVFMDNCTEEVVVPTLLGGSFTNGWWHRAVSIPNGSARTNRLVDTRSLTNALCAASEQGHRIIITDDGGTASGTNVYIYPSGNQKINQQSFTNIVTDYGSIELMIRGTNWAVVRKLP